MPFRELRRKRSLSLIDNCAVRNVNASTPWTMVIDNLTRFRLIAAQCGTREEAPAAMGGLPTSMRPGAVDRLWRKAHAGVSGGLTCGDPAAQLGAVSVAGSTARVSRCCARQCSTSSPTIFRRDRMLNLPWSSSPGRPADHRTSGRNATHLRYCVAC
jgi:hypothetical protein